MDSKPDLQTNLPIYDYLLAQSEGKERPKDLTKLAMVLNSLRPDQAEQAALILIHHYFLNNPTKNNPFTRKSSGRGSKDQLPYEIKMSPTCGFSFDLTTADLKLQILLETFCGI